MKIRKRFKKTNFLIYIFISVSFIVKSTALQVGRSRDRFPVSPGFFSVASDSSMCPGVDSATKIEYQVNPGGKGGRCVRLTTYHLHVPMSRNLGNLTSWNPVGLFRPVKGELLIVCCQVTNCRHHLVPNKK
jgi:hypothetical protein